MRGQFRVLARVFLERFFETEITGGTADLRMSLFWMMAFLAAPGIFMPIMMSIAYNVVAVFEGPEALRVMARGNKAFYLGFSMVASGGLAAIVWNSLLLDRRDSLVLGTLPVHGRTIVWAKIAALAGYIGLVAIAMHALASLSYGVTLSVHSSTWFTLRSIVAHFTASTAASAFVFLAIVAVQGLLFAALGPRRFDVASPIVQVLVAALVLGGLIILPDLDFTGSEPAPWLLRTPPLWFLGMYERILSTRDPMLIDMNRMAIAALLTVTAVTLVSYPLAYRRLVSTVVENAGAGRPRGALAAWIVRCLSRSPVTRASAQFYLASMARSAQHRFVVAASAGLSVAVTMLVLFRWLPGRGVPGAMPPIALLGLPLQAMVFMLMGLRIASALPADLPAGWIVTSAGPSSARLRAGAWRVMFALGVLLVTIMTTPIYWRWWGPEIAFKHGLVCLALGATLTEALLWGSNGMPCGRPWRPEHANLRMWWPGYLLAFVGITISLPALERSAFGEPFGTAWLLGVLAAIGLALRVSHRRRRVLPSEDLDEPGAVQVLNLN